MAAPEQHTEVAVRGFAVRAKTGMEEHYRVTCSCGQTFEAEFRNKAFDAHQRHADAARRRRV